jgi:hypothetical protein
MIALLSAERASAQPSGRSVSPGVAFAASALVPGMGQYLLGEERWVPFAVAEAWLWITFAEHRNHTSDFTRQYRDLAWSVARRVSVGGRRDSIFEYYETIAHWNTSGRFDVDPQAPDVQPETDISTFNGDTWRLARQLFIPGGVTVPVESLQYQNALAYYGERAIPPAFSWAWGFNTLEQERFRDLILQSDESARRATSRLGMILVNHLVSAVDALVVTRLRTRENAPLRLWLESSVQPDPLGGQLRVGIRWVR